MTELRGESWPGFGRNSGNTHDPLTSAHSGASGNLNRHRDSLNYAALDLRLRGVSGKGLLCGALGLAEPPLDVVDHHLLEVGDLLTAITAPRK